MKFTGDFDGGDANTRSRKVSRYEAASLLNLYHSFPSGQDAADFNETVLIKQEPPSRCDAAGPADSFQLRSSLGQVRSASNEQQKPPDHGLKYSPPSCYWEASGDIFRQGERAPGGLYHDSLCDLLPPGPQQAYFESPASWPALIQGQTPTLPWFTGNVSSDFDSENLHTDQRVPSTDLHKFKSCPKKFPRRKQLQRHFRDTHGPKTRCCDRPACPKSRMGHGFTRSDILKRHMNHCPFRLEKLRRGNHVPSLPGSAVMTPVAEAEDDAGKPGRNTHTGELSHSEDFTSEQLDNGTPKDLVDFVQFPDA